VGNDHITGGAGDDVLNGGDGNDNFNIAIDYNLSIATNGFNNSNAVYQTNNVITSTNQTVNGVAGNKVYALGQDKIDGGNGLDTLNANFDYGTGGAVYLVQSPSTPGTSYVWLGNSEYLSYKDPLAGELGLIFYNGDGKGTGTSLNGANQYVTFKNVEFLYYSRMVNDTFSYANLDLRPLYQATTSADTLYSMNGNELKAITDFLGTGTGAQQYSNNFWKFVNESSNSGLNGQTAYILSGGAGNDTLYGKDSTSGMPTVVNGVNYSNAGFDIIDGGAGTDTMIGGSGMDFYYVDNAGDQVIESATNADQDFVIVNASYSLQANTAVEALVVNGTYQRSALDSRNSLLKWNNPGFALPSSATPIDITGSNYTTELVGHDGNNVINAGTLAGTLSNTGGMAAINPLKGAVLVGMGGNDTMNGGEGNDLFFGGSGTNTLNGGLGNDRFYLGLTDYSSTDQYMNQSWFLNDVGFISMGNLTTNASHLTGGNDTAIGGLGLDTVVVGSDTDISAQRISETQLKIYGQDGSITVDASTEFVEFLGSGAVMATTYILPFIPAGDEKAIFSYIDNLKGASNASPTGATNIAYIGPSAFSDLLVLDSSNDWNGQLDAMAGNDFIIGTQNYSRVSGGDGNDRIYSSGVSGGGSGGYVNNGYRQELYGGNGYDTITVWLAGENNQISPALNADFNEKTVLLDGGAGNDIYRLSLYGLDSVAPKFELNDSAGTDTLIVALDLQSNDEPYFRWDAGRLTINNYNGTQLGSIATGVIENIAITTDNKYFNPLVTWTLLNPTTAQFSSGVLTAGATNDGMLAIAGVRQRFDGGAGNDLIQMNGVSGGVVTGGLGNNWISMQSLEGLNATPLHTLSYTWTVAGSTSEVDLNSGFSYVLSSTGASLATDDFTSNIDAFPNVIGGAANDVIRGNGQVNILDGGAGDDVIYSGLNPSIYFPPTPTMQTLLRDTLVGGAGNDVLIEQNKNSILDGGVGNDTYVLGFKSDSGMNVNPTRITETSSTGTDNGGVDTIKPINRWGVLASANYTQALNTITVSAANTYRAGDQVLIDFATGTAVDNIYTISAATANSFTVTSAVSASTSGSLSFKQDAGFDGIYTSWVDSKNFIFFSDKNIAVDGLQYALSDGLYTQNLDGSFNSDFDMIALVDKNAAEFVELGSHDPLLSGLKIKVSFDSGSINTSEVIMSSSNGPSVLNGGAGSDYVIDTIYNDILIGGEGNDALYSNYGLDVLLGGAGDDVLYFNTNGQVLSGGLGADKFAVTGTSFTATPTSLLPKTSVTDFKFWEGDKAILSQDWLDKLGENDNGEFSYAIHVQAYDFTTTYFLEKTSIESVTEYSYLFDLNNGGRGDRDSIVEAINGADQNTVFNLNDYNNQELNVYQAYDGLNAALVASGLYMI
jgi:Ca2+-binding RTX toxin-like protein